MKKIFLVIVSVIVSVTASAQTEDKTIIVTSDWHLSDSRSFNEGYYYAWTDTNKVKIEKFLDVLTEQRSQWDELVLDGDIFEFWRSPVDMYMTADEKGNLLSDTKYLERIKQANSSIFAKLQLLNAYGKKIVYLPGNHDLNVSEAEMKIAFPGLFTYAYDTEWTGLYEPFGDNTAVVIEHGNRYEYFNAPYQHGSFTHTLADASSSLPPGYFPAKLSASASASASVETSARRKAVGKEIASVIDPNEEETDSENRKYLASFWTAIRCGVGSPDYTVKTGFDGITKDMLWADYAVQENNNPTLFPDSWTVQNWKKRCELNKVPLYLPLSAGLLSSEFYDYLDEIGITERLQNESLNTLILVFGHSHVEDMINRHNDKKGDVIYMNDGAWVDATKICTYGRIKYTALTHQYDVELRQIDYNLEDKLVDARYLYVPENGSPARLVEGTTGIQEVGTLPSLELRTVVENGRIIIKGNAASYNLAGQRLK